MDDMDKIAFLTITIVVGLMLLTSGLILQNNYFFYLGLFLIICYYLFYDIYDSLIKDYFNSKREEKLIGMKPETKETRNKDYGQDGK